LAQPAQEQRQAVTYRKMSFKDIRAVHEIECESFPSPWRGRTFFARLLLPDHYGYVAEADGRVIGYVVYRVHMRTVHLQKIAVTKPYRRRGIATHLMQMMLDFVAAQKADTIYLQVRLSNVGAQEFYKRFRFNLDYVEKHYYRDCGEDAQILIRNVVIDDDGA
jgi:ribosomal-protein-alanine N-acetyltransferase